MDNMDEEQEKRIREIIKEEMEGTFAYVFSKHIQILDGRNIITGKTTGTKFPQAADQKWAAFGTTPVVQQSAISAAPSMSGTYVQSEQVVQCDRITSLIAALKNIGLTA